AIVLPNGPEFLAVFLAAVRARLVAAPLNPAYKAEEFRFYLEDAGAKVVIAMSEANAVRDAAAALELPVWTASRLTKGQVQIEGPGVSTTAGTAPEPPRPDDIGLFLHTSGTTSRPKGVPLTHANLMASARNIA